MECTQKNNMKHCICTYDCERHGKCCDCVLYHRRSGEIPGCFFGAKEEATYDRSIGNFVRSHSR